MHKYKCLQRWNTHTNICKHTARDTLYPKCDNTCTLKAKKLFAWVSFGLAICEDNFRGKLCIFSFPHCRHLPNLNIWLSNRYVYLLDNRMLRFGKYVDCLIATTTVKELYWTNSLSSILSTYVGSVDVHCSEGVVPGGTDSFLSPLQWTSMGLD